MIRHIFTVMNHTGFLDAAADGFIPKEVINNGHMCHFIYLLEVSEINFKLFP